MAYIFAAHFRLDGGVYFSVFRLHFYRIAIEDDFVPCVVGRLKDAAKAHCIFVGSRFSTGQRQTTALVHGRQRALKRGSWVARRSTEVYSVFSDVCRERACMK